jgi:hypothetical protein
MSWHPLAKAALENPEAFIEYFPQLPKRIRSLVKNMDQRLSVPPHIEEQVRGFSKADRHLLNALVSAFQCFPLHTRFPTPQHQNKYSHFSKVPQDPSSQY